MSNIIKIKSLDDYYFLSLQNSNLEQDLSSIIVIDNGVSYKESAAVIHLLFQISPIFKVLKVVPMFIGDAIYRLISRNRYKIFGKLSTCRVPSAYEKARFIE